MSIIKYTCMRPPSFIFWGGILPEVKGQGQERPEFSCLMASKSVNISDRNLGDGSKCPR